MQVQRVQAVLDTFFIEIETKLHIIFEDPKIVGIGAVVVVGLLALIVFLTEIFNVRGHDVCTIELISVSLICFYIYYVIN